MRLIQTAAVTILFLLIPHQAPYAGPAEGAAPEAAADAAGESSTPRLEADGREAGDGFVWSASAPGEAGEAWSASSDLLETDGYSWSVRSMDSDPAFDPSH